MTSRLVYHVVPGARRAASPFETALKRVRETARVQDKELLIAAPYLSLDVLRSVIKPVDWRLLTDLEEWLPSERSRVGDCATFVLDHHQRIRHLRSLHAKVYLGPDLALLGSANLTRAGFETRTEMAILVEDETLVSELHQWYAALWEQAAIPGSNAVSAYAESLGSQLVQDAARALDDARSGSSIGAPGPQVRAARVFVAASGSEEGEEATAEVDGNGLLVQRLRELASSKQEAIARLDLLREALDYSGLDEGDPRLAATMPSTVIKLALHVNQREIAAWKKRRRASEATECCFLVDESGVEELRALAVTLRLGKTKPRPGPYWAWISWTPETVLSESFKEGWKRCIEKECERRERSSYRRRHHKKAVFRCISDTRFRMEILAEAFPRG